MREREKLRRKRGGKLVNANSKEADILPYIVCAIILLGWIFLVGG